MVARLQGRTPEGTWVQGRTHVWAMMPVYPYTAEWRELHEAASAPALWTFDADNQGWIDNGGLMHPAEWQAADGRILGEPSGPPTIWAVSSSVYSLSIRPVGNGPFKVRATCAALQTGGALAAGESATMRVGFWESGFLGGSATATTDIPGITGSTGWQTHESELWQPSAEWLADPMSKIQIRVSMSYSSSIMSAGNAEWRIQLNDAAILHADGSQAQYEISPSQIGKVWDGTRWVDFV